MQASPSIAATGEDVPALFRGRSNRAAVWKVAWPSVAIGLLRTALGQIDAYMIGRLGSVELQAIGAASFAVWMVYILGELSSVGVHALSSEAEGSGKRDEIGGAIAQGLWFSALMSFAVVFLASNSAIAWYFAFVGVKDAAVASAGIQYVRVTAAWGSLPLSASACASAGFKGIGETRDALWISGVAVGLNAVLNYFFIARWGVAGAAWATNVAAYFAFFVSLAVLRRSHGVSFGLKRPKFEAMRRVAGIGAPLASSGALFSLVYMILARILARVNPVYLGSLGVGHRLEAIAYTVNEGFAVGVCTTVGQWLGAKRPKDARLSAAAAARVAVAIMIPTTILTYVTAPFTSAFFTNDATVAGAAASYLKIVSLIFPLMAIESVYEGALTGAQRTFPAFVATVFGSFLRIPLALALIPRFGVNGVWTAIALTTLVKAPAKYLAFRYSDIQINSKKRSSSTKDISDVDVDGVGTEGTRS